MEEKRMLLFVQFIHPGREHGEDVPGHKRWNGSSHRRKFVEAMGRRDDSESAEPLRFWTEWEPPSDVQKLQPTEDSLPEYLHAPHYTRPESYDGLQNTDPCVFGGFFYSICQQYQSTHRSQMQFLERGSLVLFGSHFHGEFVVDTVFVVDGAYPHRRDDFERTLKGVVPTEYLDIALRPIYAGESCGIDCGGGEEEKMRADSFCLYTGATYESKVNGMFSFFPCRPASAGSFARPAIHLDSALNASLKEGRKQTMISDPQTLRRYWSEVVAQVKRQGLEIGVFAAMPSS